MSSISPSRQAQRASQGRCARSLKEIEAIARLLVARLDDLAERLDGPCRCSTCQFDRRPTSELLVGEMRESRGEISRDLAGASWALDGLLTVLRSEWLPPFEGEFEVLVQPKG